MRVLQIIHTMGHGGAENIFRWLAWSLRQNGVDVVAGVSARNEGRDEEDWITPALKELDVPVETFDKSGGPVRLIKNLSDLVKRVRPDIVHSHLLDSNFYSSIACRRLGVPHVSTEHGDIAMNGSLSARIKFSLLSLSSDSIICVSEALRKTAEGKTLRPGRLGLIYNGINMPEEAASTFRNEFNVPSPALLIGNVANLYPVKGQRFLIDAFSRFVKPFQDSYLVFVGRGGERENLEALARELGVFERVIFTGFRKDVPNIIRSLDIYVQPSLSEGLPVSLLEVMSLGVPIIATDVGGVSELLGGNGVLLRPGSPDEIFTALARVAEKIGAFRESALAAKSVVREKFSLRRMTLEYMDVYERLLN